MDKIQLPKSFPSMESMHNTIQETVQLVWKCDISQTDVDLWLSNFKGKVFDSSIEKRIALWLLCNYTFYNENEVNFLCRNLYNQFIHDVAIKFNIDSEADIYKLINNAFFSSVGEASKSGGMILYHFRQESGLKLNRFFFPTAIPDGKDNIVVLLDDVSLSGGTISRFVSDNFAGKSFKSIYLLTLFASTEAKKKISNNQVNVISSIELSNRDKCFKADSMIFHKFPEVQEAAGKMVYEYGKELYNEPYGYSNGQYCFGFHYNTPNNTLPIFWSSRNGWKPIFRRKGEARDNRKGVKHGHFI